MNTTGVLKLGTMSSRISGRHLAACHQVHATNRTLSHSGRPRRDHP
jgi:hypothetical protein